MNRIKYTYDEWKMDVNLLSKKDMTKVSRIVSIYQGSLFFGSYLSKKYNIPLDIIRYQTRDGNDFEPTMVVSYEPLPESWDSILIIDDIIDTGKTMMEVLEKVINYYNITPDHWNKIQVLTIHGYSKPVREIEGMFPGVQVSVFRPLTEEIWVDYFTEGN